MTDLVSAALSPQEFHFSYYAALKYIADTSENWKLDVLPGS